MRARLLPVPIALAAGLLAALAAAQQPAAPAQPPPAKPAAQPASAKPGAAGEPRRDPAGLTGISPFMEQIAKGQAAFVARDIPGAVAAFQEAIKLDTGKMLGFYRLGEAMVESGKLDEADAAWKTALGKQGPEDLNAKVLFCIADLRERQKNWQGAKDAWAAYNAFLSGHPKVSGYAGTPAERQKQIDRRVKDEKDYAVVKERIQKREEERTKEAEENAKKDKLNK